MTTNEEHIANEGRGESERHLPVPYESIPVLPVPFVDFIHRGHKGNVTFGNFVYGTRPDGRRDIEKKNLRSLGSIPAKQITEMLPGLLPELIFEGVFSSQGMRGTERQTRKCSFLTCCLVDCDGYNIGLTEGQTLGALHDFARTGVIPPPTGYLISGGGGVWAIWLLRDDKGWGPIPVDQSGYNVARRAAIQRELFKRCASIGADPAVSDLARTMRLPNSRNVKGGLVKALVNVTEAGGAFVYTLGDLMDFLRIAPLADFIPDEVRRKADLSPAQRERNLKGWREVNALYLRQLFLLEELRGGFHSGHREHALTYVATYLRKTECSLEEALQTIDEVAARCSPPFDRATARGKVYRVFRSRSGSGFTKDRIAATLAITPDEANGLAELDGGKAFPPSMIFVDAPRPNSSPVPGRRKELRRATLRQIVHEFQQRGERLPVLSTLCDLIENRTGIRPAENTIRADLKSFGIRTGRERSSTTAKRPPSPSLPLHGAN